VLDDKRKNSGLFDTSTAFTKEVMQKAKDKEFKKV